VRIKVLLFALIIALFYGCKNIPQVQEEAPPESNTLTQDEIDVIDETINHIITNELRKVNVRGAMQVCINNAFFVYRRSYSDSYENDLKNSENNLKNEMAVDEKVVLSFIARNVKRRTVEKDDYFKADFFWNGELPEKPYFRAIFSNIGFDQDKTKALIYVYVDLPGLVFAEYAYLEKINDKWTFNKCLLSWKA